MPRKRTGNIIEVGSDARTHAVETLPDDGAEADVSLHRFLIEQSDGINDAQVKVYKAAGSPAGSGPAQKTVRDAFLYFCAPDDFSEEGLQSEYGAGTFRIKMYGTAPGGNYGLLCNRLLEIGPAPRSRAQGTTLAAAPGINVNVPGGDATGLARAIAEANAPVFAMLTALLQKLGGGDESRRKSLEELKELMAIAGLGQRNTPDTLAQLTGVITLAKQLAPGGDGGGEGAERGPYDVIMKAMETFGGMLAGKMPGQPAALPAPAATQAAKPAAPAPVQLSEGDAVNFALKLQLQVLLNAARAGSDPALYATLVYEQAPDAVLDALESEQWAAELLKLEPGFAGFMEWAGKVRAFVIQALNAEPDGAAPDQLTPSTPAGSVSSHAESSPAVPGRDAGAGAP